MRRLATTSLRDQPRSATRQRSLETVRAARSRPTRPPKTGLETLEWLVRRGARVVTDAEGTLIFGSRPLGDLGAYAALRPFDDGWRSRPSRRAPKEPSMTPAGTAKVTPVGKAHAARTPHSRLSSLMVGRHEQKAVRTIARSELMHAEGESP